MEAPHVPENDNFLEVPVHNLKPGMFVAELDRPWLDTPFAMQGFYVGDEVDVQYIAKYCSYVYVDPRAKSMVAGHARKQLSVREQVEFKDEFERAQVDFESASETMARVFQQLGANGQVDVVAVQEVITPLIDSVFRNREALAVLVRLKDKADYFYSHSLSTAVWAAVLGRHLGLDKQSLIDIATGAAVMDVGMTTLGDDLLNARNPLTAEQVKQVRAHVVASLKILKRSGELSKPVLNIVACHHERLNGSGYPRGLSGNDIPVFARIVGLADTYDAMISSRPYSRARSSFEAMQELQDLKDHLFQGSLVEHFVQTVGMFPTGSIVELNTGDVGVVVQQNPTRRLRPKVVLILRADKTRRNELAVIDLAKYQNGRSGEPTVWIAAELQSGAHGIQPDDYFI